MPDKQPKASQDQRLVASKWYDPNCRACPRLASYLDETKQTISAGQYHVLEIGAQNY